MMNENKKMSYTATEIEMRGQALDEQQIRQRVEIENRVGVRIGHHTAYRLGIQGEVTSR